MKEQKEFLKNSFVACLQSLIRNADKILEGYGYDCTITAVIRLEPGAAPNYVVQKTVIPSESIDIY